MDDYQNVQDRIRLMASLVEDMALDEFIANAERANDLGPFVDPSLWMKGTDKLQIIIDLAKGLRHFQKEAEKARAAWPQEIGL